jgi:SAM-dependent methyltransferase
LPSSDPQGGGRADTRAGAAGRFRRWLSHPLARGRDIDAPETTLLRRRIIAEKPFLRRIYEEWYAAVAECVPAGPEPALELGSGAGFMRAAVPRLLASDVFLLPGLDLVLDARQLPFGTASLRAVAMTNVLHHLGDARGFLGEAARCVRPGGALVMIEPWVTPWSRFVYRRLHHEPFAPEASDWTLAPGGPLSSANAALPWMIFARDRERFEREFPAWRVASIRPGMPFRYLLSGGVSLRALAPGAAFGAWKAFERLLAPWMDRLGMFALIRLERV